MAEVYGRLRKYLAEHEESCPAADVLSFLLLDLEMYADELGCAEGRPRLLPPCRTTPSLRRNRGFNGENEVCGRKEFAQGPGGNDYARGRPAATQLADRAAPSFQLLVGVLVPSFTTGSVASLAKGRCVIRGLRVHLMILRWPDGPVAMPWPRSGRTVRDRRRARRSGPRRQCRPGGRTSRPGPCAARASPRSP